MLNEQVLIGSVLAALCILGLMKVRWILEGTPKGRWLQDRYGSSTSRWILRILFASAALLGVLLAIDLIRPVQW